MEIVQHKDDKAIISRGRPFNARDEPAVEGDSDMPNGPVFETILGRIRSADFSIFDGRETEIRRKC